MKERESTVPFESSAVAGKIEKLPKHAVELEKGYCRVNDAVVVGYSM